MRWPLNSPPSLNPLLLPPTLIPGRVMGSQSQNCLSETKAALFHQSKGKASLAACRV